MYPIRFKPNGKRTNSNCTTFWSSKRLGHALIVIDVARKGSKVAVMCAEGNTPAREAHIVRNLNPMENPWFFFDGDESTLWVSVFHFGKNELRHY